MSTAEWRFFECFVGAVRGRGGRPAGNHRLVLDGVFWIARTGAQWRDLPEEFGNGAASIASSGAGLSLAYGT